MLMPKRTKYRKQFKGKMHGKALRGNTIAFEEYGLQALEPHWITNRQIEACRITINRTFRRQGNVVIRIFPHKSYTKKPLETRMGKGKGNLEGWVAVVKPGRILFEVGNVTEELAREALRKAAHKLPVKCKFVKKENGGEVNEISR
ncbi:MAG: 50S ribosomal protein L16 [Fusobacteria bacterium]|nr:50S ribosomal protein L16 [Fusobacteriota bacterium]